MQNLSRQNINEPRLDEVLGDESVTGHAMKSAKITREGLEALCHETYKNIRSRRGGTSIGH